MPDASIGRCMAQQMKCRRVGGCKKRVEWVPVGNNRDVIYTMDLSTKLSSQYISQSIAKYDSRNTIKSQKRSLNPTKTFL